MRDTVFDLIKRRGNLPPTLTRAYLAEEYDGIGQYVLVTLSKSSTSSAYKTRVAAGDFGGSRTFPAGTPVVIFSYRGQLEVFLGNNPSALRTALLLSSCLENYNAELFDPNSTSFPYIGQIVVNDTVMEPVDGFVTDFTMVAGSVLGYQPNTLHVFADDVEILEGVTELSPGDGTYSVEPAPVGVVLTESYLSARSRAGGTCCSGPASGGPGYDASIYLTWSPHFWQGSVSFTGAPGCAGYGYSIGNGRSLTPGVTYNYSVTATFVIGTSGPNFGRFQFGEGVAESFPCGVPAYTPNNVEETIGPFPEGETHTGSFLTGGEAASDLMYCFMAADHEGGATPSGHGEFWVDPPGWVPPEQPALPAPCQGVFNDAPTVSPNGVITDFTLSLASAIGGYRPGSLLVFVNDVIVSVIELDNVAATFRIAAPLSTDTITASYMPTQPEGLCGC